jgi:signal transduction histidine kinase/ligand-binding sensor domain-containing protein
MQSPEVTSRDVPRDGIERILLRPVRIMSRTGYRRVFLSALFAAGFALASPARGSSRESGLPRPSPSLAHYAHRMWQDELPQTTVHAIVQASSGYLWFGTYDGLVRFDGVRFEVFDKSTKPQLPASAVLALHEDRAGRLWIGTNAGLARLEGNQINVYRREEGLASDSITAVGEFPDGTIWAGTQEGIARLSGRRFEPFSVPAGETLRGILGAAANDEGFWFCTQDGLARLTPDGKTLDRRFDGLPEGGCRALLLLRGGSLAVGTLDGLALRRGGRFEMIRQADGLPSGLVQALLEDRRGALWVGTRDAGLARIDPVDGRIERFGSRQGLSHDLVRGFAEDREGNIWVGTSAGLDQLREANVTTHSTKDGLSNDFVRAIFEDRDGALWIGTDGGGVNRCVGDQCTILGPEEGLPGTSVRAIAQTPDGALWFGGRNGIGRRDPSGRFSVLSTENGLPSNLVRALFVDRAGDLWIGSEGSGLGRIRDGLFEDVGLARGIPKTDVLGIYEDDRGRIWAGTIRGAWLLEKDRPARHFGGADGLTDGSVFCFHQDARGGIWVGTDDGLALLQHDRFVIAGGNAGLVDRHVYRILPDEAGHLWVTTNRGVAKVSLDSLYDVLVQRRTPKVELENYDVSQGMPTGHCNGASQPAGWRTRDGHLWFPTTRGAVEIDPGRLVSNSLPPPVHLEEIVVDGRTLPSDEPASLPPGRHDWELRYTATSFVAPELVRFRYRLEGYDSDWVDAGGRRTAWYTKLPPGTYVFRVIAANDAGIWNETGASHPLEIRPTFWESIPARALYLLLLVGVVLLAHRFRIASLARKNRRLEEAVGLRTAELAEKIEAVELSRQQALVAEQRAVEANRTKSLFLSAMSHELRTPLNSIIGFAALLTERLDGKIEPRMSRFLSNIHSSGQHLLTLINDLLDLSKIEAGRMELDPTPASVPSLVEDACRLLQGIAERRKIVIERQVPDGLPHIEVDPLRIQQVLFNLLSNAVKFSPDGSKVIVRASSVDAGASPLAVPSIRMDVVDEGIGIAPEDQTIVFEEFRQADGGSGRKYEGTGLGLALVKRFLELHSGTISLESEPGRGSTFSIFLPVRWTKARSETTKKGTPEG